MGAVTGGSGGLGLLALALKLGKSGLLGGDCLG